MNEAQIASGSLGLDKCRDRPRLLLLHARGQLRPPAGKAPFRAERLSLQLPHVRRGDAAQLGVVQQRDELWLVFDGLREESLDLEADGRCGSRGHQRVEVLSDRNADGLQTVAEEVDERG